ncbi:Uncharacterised protein [BD1-7 clade bacterium]|uniref:Uncharacterized protein n=1 Tax=BD1-7 clade bacterium TaxID=2029982 RepID=A0A5S9NR47_9GAMM|nr:Uncharacterised protein [BD1-7 clade bacterium]CAA0092972.1 Uncharacterised protein [BD1-7 clade bacterium]
MRNNIKPVLGGVALLIAGAAHGMVSVAGDSNEITVQTDHENVTFIEINGNGFTARSESLSVESKEGLSDGYYTVSVSAVTGEALVSERSGNNGRDLSAATYGDVVEIVETGSFRIADGEVFTPKATKE